MSDPLLPVPSGAPVPDPPPAAPPGEFDPSDSPREVQLYYTNWRGETRARRVVPIRMWFGKTDYHPEPGWMVKALDCEDGRVKDFALAGFRGPQRPVAPGGAA